MHLGDYAIPVKGLESWEGILIESMLTKRVSISGAQWMNVIFSIGRSEECGGTHITPMLTHLIYEAPLSHLCTVFISLYVLCHGNIFRERRQNTTVLYRTTTTFSEDMEEDASKFCIICIILYSLCILG